MRENPINITIFSGDIASWQNSDNQTSLAKIVNAINDEDSASIEKLWLSTSNHVRDAFIRNKTRLAADFDFNVDELPLMGMAPSVNTRSVSSDATKALRFMQSFASRCDSRHFSVFRSPNGAMEHVFPTLNVQIKIEQSNSIDWQCFDELGLKLSDNKPLRDFVIKLYHCAIANPTKGNSSRHKLFTENTDNQIKLIKCCIATRPFTSSFLSMTPTEPTTILRFNLIEIALLFNNLDIADELLDKSAGTPIRWSDDTLPRLMFPTKNEDTSATLNWLGAHAGNASLNTMLANNNNRRLFRKAVSNNNLFVMNWIWNHANSQTRERLVAHDNARYPLNIAIKAALAQALEWLWDHMDTESRRGFFRVQFNNINHDPFMLVATYSTLDMMQNLWEKAKATNASFSFSDRISSNALATAGYHRKIDMAEWLWSKISIDTRQWILSSEFSRNFFIAASKDNFIYMRWLWSKLEINQQQKLIASALGNDNDGWLNFDSLYMGLRSLSYNGNIKELEWICEIASPELLDKLLKYHFCDVLYVALSRNQHDTIEYLSQQCSDVVKDFIREIADVRPELMRYLDRGQVLSHCT